MAVAERIQWYLDKLPPKLQAQVLDFVEYLWAKSGRETFQEDDHGWSNISLALALRDMDEQDAPDYSPADLKEVFS